MNKFKYYFIVIITSLFLFSCSKDDNSYTVEPLRDYQEQFTADNETIEEYLDTYYINTTDPNFADKDVIIEKITDPNTQPSIMSHLNSATYPKLLKRDVALHDITYSVYYLVLREGTGESPTNVDAVLTSYRGEYLYKSTVDEVTTLTPTQFEEVKYPQSFFNLYSVITGWSEIFPKFKTGTATSNSDGTVTYNDFGAGVMFLPSGLAYYSTGSGTIPSYTPLVFSFKLYAIKRSDLDGDGVPSYLEDLNGDGYMYSLAEGVDNPDDSDKDGIPNFLDTDDDNDGYTTKLEITKPTNEVGVVGGFNFGPSKYYPFEAFEVTDDPSTPNIDESLKSEPRGIPAFVGTEIVDGVVKNVYDYSTVDRLKIYLDKDHNTTKVTTTTAKKIIKK